MSNSDENIRSTYKKKHIVEKEGAGEYVLPPVPKYWTQDHVKPMYYKLILPKRALRQPQSNKLK